MDMGVGPRLLRFNFTGRDGFLFSLYRFLPGNEDRI